jgi:hypothetical protein
MKFFDFSHPLYKPLWVRALIVGICAAWSLFEFVSGTQAWAMLFGGLGAVAFYGLFIQPGAGSGARPDKPTE